MLKLLAAINKSKVKKCTTMLKEGSSERMGYTDGLEKQGRNAGCSDGLERQGRNAGCSNGREAVVSASQNIFREISLGETLLDYSR